MYGQLNKDGLESSRSNSPEDLIGTGSFSVLSAVTVVPFFSPSAQNGTSSIYLMQHFERYWTEIFHMPRSDEVFALSKSYPLVRNTILAIAACHLRHISPGVLQHRIAEHFQQSLALRDYQRLLDTPLTKLGQSGVDALLLSGALLNMLTFALPESETLSNGEPDLGRSWVFSPHENRLGWLALQEGIRHLVRSTGAYLDQTVIFLGQIFLGPDEDTWAHGAAVRSLEGVPERWIKFFELKEAAYGCDCEPSGSAEVAETPSERTRASARMKPGDIFRPAVTILSQLLNIAPVRCNFFRNLPFLGKMHSEFRALLYERDERALWLFGYWLGFMSRFEGLWWCDKRVRRDYKAIRMWLEQTRVTIRPGVEGEIWKEMMKEFDMAPVLVHT